MTARRVQERIHEFVEGKVHLLCAPRLLLDDIKLSWLPDIVSQCLHYCSHKRLMYRIAYEIAHETEPLL